MERLRRAYPDAGPRLQFRNPYEALVATILSAQSTDEQVNRVTPALFARYPDAARLSQAEAEEVEALIKSVGLYKAKARHLTAMARQVCERYGGTIPDDFEDLLALPGVGRKTANVVIANAFGLPGLGVDTHVQRVASRLGLSASGSPEGTERELKSMLPASQWSSAHHLFIFHGRKVCRARKPSCGECPVADLCPSRDKAGR